MRISTPTISPLSPREPHRLPWWHDPEVKHLEQRAASLDFNDTTGLLFPMFSCPVFSIDFVQTGKKPSANPEVPTLVRKARPYHLVRDNQQMEPTVFVSPVTNSGEILKYAHGPLHDGTQVYVTLAGLGNDDTVAINKLNEFMTDWRQPAKDKVNNIGRTRGPRFLDRLRKARKELRNRDAEWVKYVVSILKRAIPIHDARRQLRTVTNKS